MRKLRHRGQITSPCSSSDCAGLSSAPADPNMLLLDTLALPVDSSHEPIAFFCIRPVCFMDIFCKML